MLPTDMDDADTDADGECDGDAPPTEAEVGRALSTDSKVAPPFTSSSDCSSCGKFHGFSLMWENCMRKSRSYTLRPSPFALASSDDGCDGAALGVAAALAEASTFASFAGARIRSLGLVGGRYTCFSPPPERGRMGPRGRGRTESDELEGLVSDAAAASSVFAVSAEAVLATVGADDGALGCFSAGAVLVLGVAEAALSVSDSASVRARSFVVAASDGDEVGDRLRAVSVSVPAAVAVTVAGWGERLTSGRF